ncbi:hypothetical protein ABIA85_006565 [Bradyrhizobium sp. LA6.10]|uniref:hypothetical protein n=1 Tax=Bradyrhizobium sp. LA6.10 TaxID=3156318 RepID=UPI003394B8B5
MASLPFMIDRRADLKGMAVTHALLIGVSAYEHISSLDAGAHTAGRIYEWLKTADAAGLLPAPLATVTLLLSTTQIERQQLKTVADPGMWAPATCANILAARNRLYSLVLETEKGLKLPNSEIGAGTAIYYFGGHGADVFREDPIGLACDADDRERPWVACFDQLEFREHLTHIVDPEGISVEHPRRVRCLFLYDCCRGREDDATLQDAVPELQYTPLIEEPTGVRPYLALSAATQGSPAWEPDRAIALPPPHEIPLSFFGHGLLNALNWAQDVSIDPLLPWQTSAQGLVDDLKRAMDELAKSDIEGAKIPGAPVMKSSPPDFALLRARAAPFVSVMLSCDPEDVRDAKCIEVHQRVGEEYLQKRALPPWTNHPESYMPVPGMFRIRVTARAGTPIEKAVRLRPALGAWKWIIRDDAIAIQDPAD